MADSVHWVGDAPTSLHGNGATSFNRTAREPVEVTCRLCRTLLDRDEPTSSEAWCEHYAPAGDCPACTTPSPETKESN